MMRSGRAGLAVVAMLCGVPMVAGQAQAFNGVPSGDLTITITHSDSGNFSVDYTVLANSAPQASGTLSHPDPTVVFASALYPGTDYELNFPIPDGYDLVSATCTGASASQSNNVTLSFSYGSTTGEPVSCTVELDDSPAADVQMDKELIGGPQDNGDGTGTQSYEVTVTNLGDGSGTFGVSDDLSFGTPFQIESVVLTYDDNDPITIDPWSEGSIELWSDQPIGAEESLSVTIDVVFSFALTEESVYVPEGWVCEVDEDDNLVPGFGLYNSASLSTGEFVALDRRVESGSPVEAVCHDGPGNNVVVDKMVVGHEYLGTDGIAVDFDIVATNTELDDTDILPGFYQFIDLLGFTGSGVEPLEIELLSTEGFQLLDDESPEPDLGDGDFGIVLSEENSGFGPLGAVGLIQPGSAHTYRVRVTYAVDLELGFSGTCPDFTDLVIDEEVLPGGAINVLIWASAFDFFDFFGDFLTASQSGPIGAERRPEIVVDFPENDIFPDYVKLSYDCLDLGVVSVEKTIDGGDAEPDDFTFEVLTSEGDVERTLTHDTPALIVAGDYTIAEVADPDYSASISCSAEPIGFEPFDPTTEAAPSARAESADESGHGSTAITVNPSDWVHCDAVNTSLLADLSVVKSDGDATAVAGGAPITYTFTVTNEGGFLDGDVTLLDALPSGWSWVAGSATGCTSVTITGQELDCTIANSLLAEGGDEAVVTAQARVAADTASGDAVNVVRVGSEAEPLPDEVVCDGLSKDPHPNFDCETTPVVREATISASKVSNASGPVSIGATVIFTLTMTNNGPSTLLPGSTMVDDLPAGLNLISISAPGWTCGAVDPVVCEYGGSLAVGATAPAIQIVTTVASGASGTITNTGVFTGVVDVAAEPPATQRLSRTDALPVVVTTTAVASAVAVIEVRSRGSIPATGIDTHGWTLVAALLVGVGLFGVLVTRRRRFT